MKERYICDGCNEIVDLEFDDDGLDSCPLCGNVMMEDQMLNDDRKIPNNV